MSELLVTNVCWHNATSHPRPQPLDKVCQALLPTRLNTLDTMPIGSWHHQLYLWCLLFTTHSQNGTRDTLQDSSGDNCRATQPPQCGDHTRTTCKLVAFWIGTATATLASSFTRRLTVSCSFACARRYLGVSPSSRERASLTAAYGMERSCYIVAAQDHEHDCDEEVGEDH
jgi:hypothetical protein